MALNTTFSTGAVLTAAQMNNLPFGYVANANVTSSQTGIGAQTDITGLTVTITAVANRQYMAIITVSPYGTLDEQADTFLYVDGASVRSFRSTFSMTNKLTTVTYQHQFTTTAGSRIVKVRMAKVDTNNVNNYADGSLISSLTVIDLGDR